MNIFLHTLLTCKNEEKNHGYFSTHTTDIHRSDIFLHITDIELIEIHNYTTHEINQFYPI